MFEQTKIKDLIVFTPRVFGDARGYFFESYSRELFRQNGIDTEFVQDNQSFSTKGILRGLHLQKGQHAQAKLVRVVKGEVYDFAVDLRKGSPTYGQWEGVLLTGENQKQFFIPRGFAHGFLVISDEAIFSYKCDNYYNKEAESGLKYNDQAVGIVLPIDENFEIKANERDLSWPDLQDVDSEIEYK